MELLNSTDRHRSADVFSLGLTVYELSLLPALDVLPYAGQLWHDLRKGTYPDISTQSGIDRPQALSSMIRSCLRPDPSCRPNATSLLHDPFILDVDISHPCLVLIEAPIRAASPAIFQQDCFFPIQVAGETSTGDHSDFGNNSLFAINLPARNLSTPVGLISRVGFAHAWPLVNPNDDILESDDAPPYDPVYVPSTPYLKRSPMNPLPPSDNRQGKSPQSN
jgi:serine/threonine protein kinase